VSRKRSRGLTSLLGPSSGAGVALLATVALVGAFARPAPGAPNRAPATTFAPYTPRGKLLGVVPSRPAVQPAVPSASAAKHLARASARSPLVYHGGPVQHSSAIYAIFWVPSPYSFPAGYANLVSRYFSDVAHDGYKVSNVYASDTQYYDMSRGVKQFVPYSVSYSGAFAVTDPLPIDGCPNYLLADGSFSTNCITDAQIETEVSTVIASHHLPTGLGAEYFVFTPQGLASCGDASALVHGGCYAPLNYNGYCAYHSSTTTSQSAVLYADMPYIAFDACSSGQSPNANPADALLSATSHEHNETITDPLGNAWYDSQGNENGDKCATTYGAPLGTTGSGQFNQVINGHDYWLQQEWSNRANACVQANTYPQPTASFTYTPGGPAHGTNVRFTVTVHDSDDTRFTYHWTFPNGKVSTLRRPIHAFGLAGTKTVTLIVVDAHGDQIKVTQTISVT